MIGCAGEMRCHSPPCPRDDKRCIPPDPAPCSAASSNRSTVELPFPGPFSPAVPTAASPVGTAGGNVFFVSISTGAESGPSQLERMTVGLNRRHLLDTILITLVEAHIFIEGARRCAGIDQQSSLESAPRARIIVPRRIAFALRPAHYPVPISVLEGAG